jgi:hypothetical protein
MVTNAVVSGAKVAGNVPAETSSSQNTPSSGEKNAPITATATELWQALFKSSVECRDGNVKLTLEKAIANANQLVSDLVDGDAPDDLRQDIVANLQCLKNSIGSASGDSADARKTLIDQINKIKIKAVLTQSVLDQYSPVEKEV